MARLPKSVSVIIGEGNSLHLTKKELAARQAAENSMLTGVPMKESPEVKADNVAHAEFMRIKQLFKVIGKDDDLVAGEINTYCLMHAQACRLSEQLNTCQEAKQRDRIEKMLMKTRRFMFDIEKENLMTVNSALRAVPKKAPIKAVSKMAAMIERRGKNNEN